MRKYKKKNSFNGCIYLYMGSISMEIKRLIAKIIYKTNWR